MRRIHRFRPVRRCRVSAVRTAVRGTITGAGITGPVITTGGITGGIIAAGRAATITARTRIDCNRLPVIIAGSFILVSR